MPEAARDPTLTIEAVNVSRAPVEVTVVYAGFVQSSLPAEVVFGRGTVKLPLRELTGTRQMLCVLQAGETASWIADLIQLAEELEERRLTLTPHSRFLDFNRLDVERWTRRGSLAIIARNAVAMYRQRRLAVIISDGRAGFHKAKVRWQSPLRDRLRDDGFQTL